MPASARSKPLARASLPSANSSWMHILFGVGLVQFFFVFLVVFVDVIEIADGGIVDGVLFFEVVLSFLFVRRSDRSE